MKVIKGIYLIERISESNDDEPHYYVGQAVDIFKRFNEHCIGIEQYIDRAIAENGVTNFVFRVLETVPHESDLDTCEQKWIENYKEQYGEKALYNIIFTNNSNPHAINSETRNEIRELFENDIKQSIYAIASHFDISFKEVVKIREKFLEEKGLKYDKKLKQVVNKSTNEVPKNWMGGQLTRKIAKQVDECLKRNFDKSDIAHECNLSAADLKYYLDADKSKYKYAPEIKK